MGWNQVQLAKHSDIKSTENPYAYFVHSYCYKTTSDDICVGVTDYHGKFSSIVTKDNVWAMQFHPEKSAAFGLSLLKQFFDLHLSASC